MANEAHAVPRRAGGARGFALLRRRTIEIIFQRYPGTDAASAISGLDYEVTVGRGSTRRGRTGNDGKLTIRIAPFARARLNIMGTEYRVRARSGLERFNHLRGVQRRLNMLGYNAGAVDGSMGPKTEHAVLNFQADNAPLKVDGLPGPRTQRALRDKVGR